MSVPLCFGPSFDFQLVDSSRKIQPNGIDYHHTNGLLNDYPLKDDKPAMQVESQMNGNMDHDMEVLCEDAKPMSAVQFEKLPTKLSVPQRCMGSHFM